ncbi:MAG: hypothetical protein ACKOTE_14710, partial [Opitutaceae bacterium]
MNLQRRVLAALIPTALLALLFYQRLAPTPSPASMTTAPTDGRAPSAGSVDAKPAARTVANDPACDPLAATGSFADRVAEQRRLTEAVAKTRAFEDWITTWRRAHADESRPLIASGVAAAQEYRSGLKELIALDPKRALERAAPAGLRRELPPEVLELLEQRLDARGELEVSVWHRGAEARYDRVARIAGTEY